MTATSRNRTRTRLAKGEVVDIARLDELLDVGVEAWDRAVKRLVREMRTKDVGIELPGSQILDQDGGPSAGVSWPRLFEAQTRSLPRMDRAEEFRMARRYEFLKARVRDALVQAGYRDADADELVLIPFDELPEPARTRPEARRERLRSRMAELSALRSLYVESALHLVPQPVRRYRGLGVDEGDLIQEGNASLFQAIEGFDWRRDVRFRTYAIYWIQQAILKALYDSSRTVRIPVWVQKVYRKIQRLRDQGLSQTGMAPGSTAIADQLGIRSDRVDEILGVRRFAVSLDQQRGDDDSFSIGQTLPDDSPPVVDQIQEGDLRDSLGAAMADIPARERMILERRFGLDDREPETLAEIAADLGITAERVRQLQNAAIGRLKKPRRLRMLRAFA